MRGFELRENLYNFWSMIFRRLRILIRFVVLISPWHRVRDEEADKFIGIVIMRPYIDSDGFQMIDWLWFINGKFILNI